MYDGTDLVYFLTDHLGSTVGVLDDTGTDINILLEENRYAPFGEVRDITGSLDPITETDFGYTGQRDLGGVGLMDYNARFYSPTLGRFVQPDTLVPEPGDSQAWNRYSYTSNNPIKFIDPTGHMPEGPCGFHGCPKPKLPPPPPNCWENPEACSAANGGSGNGGGNGGSEGDGGLCGELYGASACEQWNQAFSPWFGYPEEVRNDLEQAVTDGAYGGWDNLMKEAAECIATGNPEECENPYMPGDDVTLLDFGGDKDAYKEYLAIRSEYFGKYSWAVGIFNYNNLMIFLVQEVGADSENPYNFDPIWLSALATDQTVFHDAEFKAFEYMINQGFEPGINDEEFQLIWSGSLYGTAD